MILQESKPVSKNSDLSQLLGELALQMKPAEQVSNSKEIVKLAITKTVVTVGKLLLDKQAILLASIHNLFRECVTEIAVLKGMERPEDVTSRWILSKLANLQHHIAYKCKVRKYGTLIYRGGDDLILAMSKLLNRSSPESNSTSCSCEEDDDTNDSHFDQLSHIIHKQIDKFVAEDAKVPFEYDELDFNEIIKSIDARLFACLLGQNLS